MSKWLELYFKLGVLWSVFYIAGITFPINPFLGLEFLILGAYIFLKMEILP